MDFDFGINRNEEKPLFNSLANAMTSMKKATAEKIYRRNQKEGMTKYSKPQVDRALAKALNYGIFELRNNNFRVTDNILDDEDTIYWRAQIKQEESPSRMQDGDYINPEKDGRTFRRLSIFENSRSFTDQKRKVNVENKKKSCQKNYAVKVTGKIKKKSTNKMQDNNKDGKEIKNKSNGKKGSKSPKPKMEEKKLPPKIIRRLTFKDTKKITKDPKDTYDVDKNSNCSKLYQKLYSGDESNTDSLSTLEADNDIIEDKKLHKIKPDCNEDYVNEGSGHEKEDEDDYNSDFDDEDDEDDDDDDDDDDDISYYEDDQYEIDSDKDQDIDRDSGVSDDKHTSIKHNSSSFIDSKRNPIPSDITLSTVKETSKNALKRKIKDNILEKNSDYRENSFIMDENRSSLSKASKWNEESEPIENNFLNEGYENSEWIDQNLQNTYVRQIKQFDNALKIEPIDLLPFKNIGEPSYIS